MSTDTLICVVCEAASAVRDDNIPVERALIMTTAFGRHTTEEDIVAHLCDTHAELYDEASKAIESDDEEEHVPH